MQSATRVPQKRKECFDQLVRRFSDFEDKHSGEVRVLRCLIVYGCRSDTRDLETALGLKRDQLPENYSLRIFRACRTLEGELQSVFPHPARLQLKSHLCAA